MKSDFVQRLRRHFRGATWLLEHNGRPYSRVSVTNRIKHQSLLVLGKQVSAQNLRHTWAAIQIKRGRSVSAVAALLGHSNPGLTARMYPDASPKPKEAFPDLGETDKETRE